MRSAREQWRWHGVFVEAGPANGQGLAAVPVRITPLNWESDLQKTYDLERTGRGVRLEALVRGDAVVYI